MSENAIEPDEIKFVFHRRFVRAHVQTAKAFDGAKFRVGGCSWKVMILKYYKTFYGLLKMTFERGTLEKCIIHNYLIKIKTQSKNPLVWFSLLLFDYSDNLGKRAQTSSAKNKRHATYTCEYNLLANGYKLLYARRPDIALKFLCGAKVNWKGIMALSGT